MCTAKVMPHILTRLKKDVEIVLKLWYIIFNTEKRGIVMALKYVRFPGKTIEFVALIIPSVNHDEVAKLFEYDQGKPISAGMVRIAEDGTIECYGESTTLNLKPAEDDAMLIEAF